eukprot:1321788-Pyramimonas_sp.AAC.1
MAEDLETPAGSPGDAAGQLRPGNVVALFSPCHKRFIRLMNERVMSNGPIEFDNLPLLGPDRWSSEVFTVVDVGKGEIALHSPWHGIIYLHTAVCYLYIPLP